MSEMYLSLQRHRFGISEVPNAASKLRSLVYVQDIDGRDDMNFSVISSIPDAKNLFAPGDYAVLRDMLGYTLSWGRVLTRRTQIVRARGGELSLRPYPVSVAGWWDFQARAQVHVLLGDTSGPYAQQIGNVWPVQAWIALVAELTASYGTAAGVQLAWLLKQIGTLQVPESLGGGKMGDLIPVVHDEETALKYAPRFSGIEPVDNGSMAPDRLINMFTMQRTTVGSVLNSVFVPDNTLIELFPAMVDGGTEPYNSLASALGRRPVLVYRIKPWREEPLWKNTVAKAAYTYEDFEASVLSGNFQGKPGDATPSKNASDNRVKAKQRNRQLLIKDNIFKQVTLDATKIVPIPESFVRSLEGVVDDSARVNGVTISVAPMGGDVIDTLSGADLPILIDDQIEKHGLRMATASWPFIGADGQADPAFYRTAAAQVMQFSMMNHVLEKGVMRLHYTASTTIRSDDGRGQTVAEPTLELWPGQWFRVKLGGMSEYLGYVVALQHSMDFTPEGARSVETTVQFVRGHYVEVSSLVHNGIVPIGDKATPPTKITANSVPQYNAAVCSVAELDDDDEGFIA